MVENFDAKLNEYAHLLVEVGMNVQPGQTPSIESNVEYVALTRLCVSA
ncbi:MAG: aminopeptidase, partial [Clostridiales bacterium]|nr:aminopeptidase [Clostridiales bacterium]